MRYTILTLFPNIINEYISSGILKKAIDKGTISVDIIDLRNFGKTKRRNTDDTVYGGGVGMVISVDVLDNALQSIDIDNNTCVIYTTPKGKTIDQNLSKELKTKYKHIVIICGHYEGIDERIFKLYNILEVSIGEYILTGGELAALVILDSTARLVENVLKKDAIEDESFENNLLEEPKYTKPTGYKGLKVPEILISGDHKKVDEYRLNEKIYETYKKRPDLLRKYIKENNNELKVKEIINEKEGGN